MKRRTELNWMKMQSKVVTSIRENIFGVYWRMPEMKCSFWFWHLIMRIAEFIRDSEWLSKSWVYFCLFCGIPKWLSELMAAIDRLTWMYFVLWRFSLTDFSLRRAQCVFFSLLRLVHAVHVKNLIRHRSKRHHVIQLIFTFSPRPNCAAQIKHNSHTGHDR